MIFKPVTRSSGASQLNVNPPCVSLDLRVVCLCLACTYATRVVQFGRVAVRWFAPRVTEALKQYIVLETKQECIVYTTGATDIHIFKVRINYI